MKASVVRGFGQGFELADIDIAMPIGCEVLVDVRASGLCHSDESASTRPLGGEPPMVLGYEVAGIVAAIGPDVTEVKVGDHVVGCLVRNCGSCKRCAAGKPTLCLNPGFTERGSEQPLRLTESGTPVAQGLGVGGFAQQVLLHEHQIAVIPDELPWPQAALLGCGVITGAGAVLNTANVQPSDVVVVIGGSASTPSTAL